MHLADIKVRPSLFALGPGQKMHRGLAHLANTRSRPTHHVCYIFHLKFETIENWCETVAKLH
jgi:hypothetical protein